MLLASLGLCAACAPVSRLPDLPAREVAAEKHRQEVAQIKDYYAQLNRLDTVAFRIRTANVADCKERIAPQIGLFAATPSSLPRKYRSAAASEALSLRWVRATVISVVEGSPAGLVGMKTTDELIAFNGEPVPVTGTMAWINRWLKKNGTRPVEISFRRSEENTSLTVAPVMSCAIPIVLQTEATSNAYTTDDKIVVYSGILRIAKTDAQLAEVVGHELAHSNLGHLDKKRVNTVLGWASGAAVDIGILAGGVSSGGAFTRAFTRAGALVFSVGFEREADYVGAYYAARAGYDLAGAEQFWRDFSLDSPDSIRFATTHPVTPDRFVQMQKVAAEIADKQRRHLPLIPELKMDSVKAEPDIPPARESIH